MGAFPEDYSNKYLEDLFLLEGQFLGTRSSEAFKARLKEDPAVSVLLWALRHPLAPGSAAVERFAQRMQRTHQAQDNLGTLVAFGVDKEGTAFAALEPVPGAPLGHGMLTFRDALASYLACVQQVALFHRNGLVLGDLCLDSFIATQRSVHLVGILGTFDSEATATIAAPPMVTMPFMAPEQRTGGGIEQASDIFALGVLGFYLLSNQFPYGEGMQLFATEFDIANVPKLASLAPATPDWIEESVRRALEPEPERRFDSAEAMADFLETHHRAWRDSKSRAASSRMPRPTKPPVQVTERAPAGQRERPSAAVFGGRRESEPKPTQAPHANRRSLLPLLTVLAVVWVLILVWQGSPEQQPGLISTSLDPLLATPTQHASKLPEPTVVPAAPTANVDPTLRNEMKVVAKELVNGTFPYSQLHPQLPESSRPILLEELANLDSPKVYAVLREVALNAESVAFRRRAEKALLAELRKSGNERTAEQLRQWLRAHRSRETPIGYAKMLQALDLDNSLRDTTEALLEAGVAAPTAALKIAAALFLDLGTPKDLSRLVSELAVASTNSSKYQGRAAPAVILAHPALAGLYAEEALQELPKLPRGDLTWLLAETDQENHSQQRSILRVVLNQENLDPVEKALLSLLSNPQSIPGPTKAAIIGALRGDLSPDDAIALSFWKSQRAYQAMVVICATSNSDGVVEQVFRLLATDDPTGIARRDTLFGWAIRAQGSDRANLMRGLCALNAHPHLPDEVIQATLSVFDRFFKDSDFQELVIQEGNPVLGKRMLERHGSRIDPETLLGLLEADDPALRISAIKALKETNELSVLREIKSFFRQERDGRVRDAYLENFELILGPGNN